MPKVKDVIARLQRMNQEDTICIPIWSIADVLDRDSSLTKEQAENILDKMHMKHDASIGINWDVIDSFIEFSEK